MTIHLEKWFKGKKGKTLNISVLLNLKHNIKLAKNIGFNNITYVYFKKM